MRTTEKPLTWFRFNPSDFHSRTMGLDSTDLGAYMKLLIYSWVNGPLPNNPKVLKRIVGKGDVATLIEQFFEIGENGKLYDPWLESLREESSSLAEANRQRTSKARAAQSTPTVTDSVTSPVTDPVTGTHNNTVHNKTEREHNKQEQNRQNIHALESSCSLVSNPPSIPDSQIAQAEKLARAANSTVEQLLNSRPEGLSSVQRSARMKIIQLQNPTEVGTVPAERAA